MIPSPHKVMEDMADTRKLFFPRIYELFDRKIWDVADVILPDAVHFDFADITPSDAHTQFAFDMLDKGLYRLPFRSVFYTAKCSPETGLLCISEMVDGQMVHGVIACAAMLTSHDDHKRRYVPLLSIHYVEGADNEFHYRQASLDGQLRTRSTNEPLDGDMAEDSANRVVRAAFSFTAMLMSREIEQTIVPAPIKLNLSRQRKGRPQIKDRRVISIRMPQGVRMETGPLSGTRKSPIVHWRRGHVRRLRNGKLHSFPPVLVNGTEDAKNTVKPKLYQFAPCTAAAGRIEQALLQARSQDGEVEFR